ncbi:hypothetical protein AB0O91_11485 [Kitasatospora sp. NPDC089797]|uniref:hypothetical protein n=1 Tax=Kitasatospora sp. NPDC089797 TaxID=3155298 RepID=UPI0034449ED1
MSTNRSRRIDRDAAEQLLGGAVGGPSAGQDASLTGPDGPGQLARVLAAAAAPATAAELAGEEAALAAFRAASLTPDPVVTPVRRRSMATAALARAFSTKAAAAVLGATALCGVAVAAGTGNLPALGGGPSEPEHRVAASGGPAGSLRGAPEVSAQASPSTGGSARPSTGGRSDPHPVLPSVPAEPDDPTGDGHADHPAPPAALVPLCQAFADRTGRGDRPGGLAGDPAFAPLIAAAGGADGVADFCEGALDGGEGDQGGDHQGATTAQGGPGRNGSGPGSGSGSRTGNGAKPDHGAKPGEGAKPGKGGGDGGDQGRGNTRDGAHGGGNGGGGGNSQDGGGNGTRPGKGGVTLPAPSTAPTLPDVRPSRTRVSEDEQSARR